MSKRKTPLKKRVNVSAIETNLRKLKEDSKKGQLRYDKIKRRGSYYPRKEGSFISR
ncbi:MAG: hypothetical protein U9P50_02075 [Patescibacteria group bacterium]|nr:hypothetical protein [Patescibacteria group bacterium]